MHGHGTREPAPRNSLRDPEVLAPSFAASRPILCSGWVPGATISRQTLLGELQLRRGRHEDARRLLREAIDTLVPNGGVPVRTVEAMEPLVLLYEEWGKPDQAAAWRKRVETETEKLPQSDRTDR